jgi:hypothetical protein
MEAVKNAIKYFDLVMQHGREERRGSTRYKIGQCCSALYLRTKDINDLLTAIDNLQAATEVKLENEERQGALTELSRTYSRKYEVTRNKGDLEAAIHWGRLAVQENQGEPWILRNLANLLYWTFKDWKDPKVLDAAIEYYEVLWALYQTKPARSVATFYYAYGTALIRRYDLAAPGKGSIQDIERAVDLLQLAVGGARPEDKADHENRLKGALVRRDRAKRHSNTSPPSTLRSSNTIGFPSPPNSPSAMTFVEPADMPKRVSGAPRRTPIPSLSVRPDTATLAAASSATVNTSSTISENSASSRGQGALSRTPSTRSKRFSTSSQSTIMPMPMPMSANGLLATPRKGQMAPSLLSESMSVMTVPAVNDLPNGQFQQARPRVLRRQTKTLPAVPLVKTPPATKLAPLPPTDKSRPGFLSFARIRGSKAP